MAEHEYDINTDGNVSEDELAKIELIKELEARFDKAESQKRMAWVAMFSMIAFTIFLFMPFVSEDRIKLMVDLSTMFYVAQASVIGAYMGFTTWMARK